MCELKMEAQNISTIKHLPVKVTIVFEECKKQQTVATSEAFFQYSFATQIQKKSFYSKKKRFEYRRKRVNSEANFRAMYT